MKYHYKANRFVSLALLSLATFSSNVFAAQTENKDILEMSLEELLTLKIVEVTARKKTEDIQNIPVSLSVISGEHLDTITSAAKDLRFLSNRIPSLVVESSFDRLYPRFYIRGLGNTDFDINASQPVSVVLDGVVQENAMLKGIPLFDFERVEILRGPQGTLFGRNTPAGLIKFESKKPTSKFSSYANLALGSQRTVDFEGAINGSLNDVWSARLSLLKQRRENWIDNAAPGFEQNDVLGGFDELATRLQFKYQFDQSFDALFNFHYRNFDANPAVFRANIITAGSNRLNENFIDDTVFLDAANRTKQSLSNRGSNITLNFNFERYKLTTITGYESVEVFSLGDVDGGFGAAFLPESGPGLILFPAESASAMPSHRQITQEVRLATNEHGRFDYQVGLFYFEESLEIESFSFDTLAQGLQNGFSTQNQGTDAWAVFGTLDYDVQSNLKLTLGIRYSSDDKHYRTERFQSPVGAGPISEIKVKKGDNYISWDFSVLYDLNDKTKFYLRTADTFRAPSIQGRLTFGDEVTTAESENVLSSEIGIKSIVLDGRGRINAAIYNNTIDNQQITAVGGEANINRLINVDRTEGYGFELDSEFIISEHWRWSANMSYNKTRLEDENLSVSICSQCTVTNPIDSNGFALIDGNNLPHAPSLIYNLNINYQTELGNGLLSLSTDWSYRSEIDFFLYQSLEFIGEALLEGGFRAAYQWQIDQKQFEAALFVRNLTNQQVLIGGVDFNNLTGIVNEPRFVGMEFKTSF